MKILLKDSFLNRLENQIEYIAKDSPTRARKFYKNILQQIKGISSNPYKHRKSIYFEEETIRDLIYKGYTIIFRINKENIEVFGFVKYQEKPYDEF